MTVLITGSAGYIGSHCMRSLLSQDVSCVGLDNLHTGLMSNQAGMMFIGDIRRKDDIRQVFDAYKPSIVMHFAALTSVPESMKNTDEYTEVNLEGTQNLVEVMKEYKCNKLIFSSTASVYKQSNEPLKETDVIQPLNHYAVTKWWAEQFISQQDWLDYIIFRYFNVIGYDEDFDTSHEMDKTNLVPALLRTVKYGHEFNVFGNGYPVTRENKNDHTCVRDYIDVRDIANGHIRAIDYLFDHPGTREVFNLGTKNGSSVLELISAFEKANNCKIDYEIKGPRRGDPASLIADNRKSRELLRWEPQFTLEESLKIPEPKVEED